MKIQSQKDWWAGLMFLAIGVAFAIGARNYNMGTGARMGPAYFPFALGCLLAVLGIIISLRATRHGRGEADKIGTWAWKPLLFILGANVLFGVLLAGMPSIKFPSFGLIVAIFALTFVASYADGKPKVRETAILAAVLAAGSYAAFILLLKLQIPVWPAFLA